MTAAQARLIGYLAGVALGVFMTVYGVLVGDVPLWTTGLALVGVGSTAGGTHAREKFRE